MSPSTKDFINKAKPYLEKTRNAFDNLASPFFKNRSPPMNDSGDKSKLDPLEQALEMQNEDNPRRRNRRRRENQRAPAPISRPYEKQAFRKRRHKERTTSQKASYSLCTSDVDTDSDTDTKFCTPAQLAPMNQTPNRPKKTKCQRKGCENTQAIESKMPSYPTSRMMPLNHSDQKSSDDENDVVILEKEDSKSSKRQKRVEASGSRLDMNTPSTYDEVDRKNQNTKEETPETSLAIRNGEIEGQIPKKKVREPTIALNRTGMTVPAIKETKYEKRKRPKHYVDVDMNDDNGNDHGNDGDAKLFPPAYISEMKEVINFCENDSIKDKTYGAGSTSRATNSSGSRMTTRRLSGKCTSLKKVNNSDNRKALNSRPKRQAAKIIPGLSLIRINREKEQSQWRSEKDQDAYHVSNKETQDEDAMQWNPLAGANYESSVGMMTRNRTQYGTKSQKTVDILESPMTKRRKRESPTTRRQKRMKQKKPETIDILSSDSEDDAIVVTEKEECDVTKFNLKRLAVGEQVYNSQDHRPIVTFHDEKIAMEIIFSKSGRGDVEEKISVIMSDIEDFSNWTPSDTNTKNYPDLDSFIWIRSNVTMQSISKRRGRDSKKDTTLVLEFEDDKHMSELCEIAADSTSPMSISPDDLEIHADALISDSKKKYKLRSKVKPHKIDDFISGRRSDEILLVYPFGEDSRNLEAAAEGLKELSWKERSEGGSQDPVGLENGTSDSENLVTAVETSENTLVATQGGQRSHFIEIRVEDYERLDTKQWLNDSLVDMWMQWISRHIACKRTSNVHFFTSHFYTTLASDGVEGVQSWTAKKNINIFDKKLIFIPINKTLHWSLCVVVNPGKIKTQSEAEDSPLPCVLFFDSLNMHQKTRVHRHVMNWLNSEWKRKTKSEEKPFEKQIFKIYDPQVPRQNNGSDCGVFVCRYAFAMFQLRNRKFTRREATLGQTNENERKSRKKTRSHRSQAFVEMITNGEEFNFDVDDIQRIRRDFKTLIKQLHPLYKAVKEGKIKAEKEEKLARKKHREKNTDTSAAPALNLIDDHGRASNDLSDSSSKENCVPRGDGDSPLQQIPKSNGDERQDTRGLAGSEGSQQHSALEEMEEMGSQPGLHPALDYTAGGNETFNHQIPLALSTSVVQGEEMADSDKIAHF